MVSPDSSYCWKSVCTAMKVLSLGLRQVRNGESINIWEHPWVPFPSTFHIFSPNPIECILQNVNQLTHSLGTWSLDLLGSLFTDTEVEAICAIPLCLRRSPDHLIWHFEKNGKFSVRCVYHTAREWLIPINNGASSFASSGLTSKFWAKVWQANVPPKVRICFW
ncbi:hypothetical protein ACFX2G_040694 [Malus domestica]